MKTLLYYPIEMQTNLLNEIKLQNEEVGEDESLELGLDDIAGVLPMMEKKKREDQGQKNLIRKERTTTSSSKPKGSSLFRAWKKGRTNM